MRKYRDRGKSESDKKDRKVTRKKSKNSKTRE